jgi:hypothetical protein
MPILRYRPGEEPPEPGKYELVDHFGEQLNVEAICLDGERLPFVAVRGYHSVWFVQAAEVNSVAQAA